MSEEIKGIKKNYLRKVEDPIYQNEDDDPNFNDSSIIPKFCRLETTEAKH